MTINRFVSRIRNLESQQPSAGDTDALRERIERARARVEASLTDEERAYRHTPEYLAAAEARRRHWQALTERRRGRHVSLAERVTAMRD